MRISNSMDLHQLESLMGDLASREEAVVMRDMLVSRFDGDDTSSIGDAEWLELLRDAATCVHLSNPHNPLGIPELDDLLVALAEWDAWSAKLDNKGV